MTEAEIEAKAKVSRKITSLNSSFEKMLEKAKATKKEAEAMEKTKASSKTSGTATREYAFAGSLRFMPEEKELYAQAL